jgi:RNA polymerase sigma-70 factor (sigma-E family)
VDATTEGLEVDPGSQSRRTSGRLVETYERYAPDAVRLAYLMTGDHALAEDLAQEAFVRMAARLAYLREPDATWPYLRRSVINLAKNHYRHRSVEQAYLQRVKATGCSQTDPDVVSHESMRKALLGLPERQRAAIVLRYYEDLPESEIAALLRCRPGTVRSLLSRATVALRTSGEVTADV